MIGLVKDKQVRARIATVIAGSAAALSNGRKSAARVWEEIMNKRAPMKLRRQIDRWLPQFLSFGHLKDTARSGRPSAGVYLGQEAAALAVAGAVSGFEHEGIVYHNRNEAAAVRNSPVVQAAMDVCRLHGITRPTTVFRGALAAASENGHTLDIRVRRARLHERIKSENELARTECAAMNLERFTSNWKEEERENDPADAPPFPLRVKANLMGLIQIDSKKLYVMSRMRSTSILCAGDDLALTYGLDKACEECPVINYYIAVNALVGVLAVVLVSGTTEMDTTFQVRLASYLSLWLCAQRLAPPPTRTPSPLTLCSTNACRPHPSA